MLAPLTTITGHCLDQPHRTTQRWAVLNGWTVTAASAKRMCVSLLQQLMGRHKHLSQSVRAARSAQFLSLGI